MEVSEIKKYKEDYESSSISKKCSMVLGLLENLKERGKIFDDFYRYISQFPEELWENDFDKIFEVILIAIYKDGQWKIQEASLKLENIKNTLQRMKETEKNEKESERNIELLEQQFSSL